VPRFRGVTSKVYLGTHKRTKDNVAIKIIGKKWLINNAEIAREVGILKRLRHPNIIGLKDVFITEQDLQIVMELYDFRAHRVSSGPNLTRRFPLRPDVKERSYLTKL